MNAILRNRCLWAMTITVIAMIFVAMVTKPGRRTLELFDGVSIVLVAAFLVGVVVVLAILMWDSHLPELRVLWLVLIILAALLVGDWFLRSPDWGFGWLKSWWNTRGVLAAVILTANALVCYLFWVRHEHMTTPQQAAAPPATATTPAHAVTV